MRWLVVLFVALPLVEIYFLSVVSAWVSFWPTVGIVFGTGILGSWLAKREGQRVWEEWRRALTGLSVPEHGLVDGILVLIGAALLITPGLVSDLMGLALLLPVTRRKLAHRVKRELDRRMAQHFQTSGGTSAASFSGAPFTPSSAVGRRDAGAPLVVETEGKPVEVER